MRFKGKAISICNEIMQLQFRFNLLHLLEPISNPKFPPVVLSFEGSSLASMLLAIFGNKRKACRTRRGRIRAWWHRPCTRDRISDRTRIHLHSPTCSKLRESMQSRTPWANLSPSSLKQLFVSCIWRKKKKENRGKCFTFSLTKKENFKHENIIKNRSPWEAQRKACHKMFLYAMFFGWYLFTTMFRTKINKLEIMRGRKAWELDEVKRELTVTCCACFWRWIT